MNIRKQLLNLDLPEIYRENIITYTDGLDAIPEFSEMAEQGYTLEKYMKLLTLVGIEHLKYMLARDIGEMSPKDVKMAEEHIKKSIAEYNNM